MPRKKAFENDDYDPISAEVARAAAYAGRGGTSETAAEATAEPETGGPSTGPLLRERILSAPQREAPAEKPPTRRVRKRKVPSELVRTLTADRDRALGDLRALQELRGREVTALERTIGQLEGEVHTLRDSALAANRLRSELRWARVVSVGTMIALVAIALWLILGPNAAS